MSIIIYNVTDTDLLAINNGYMDTNDCNAYRDWARNELKNKYPHAIVQITNDVKTPRLQYSFDMTNEVKWIESMFERYCEHYKSAKSKQVTQQWE